MVCLFIFIYANTSGPVSWVYSAETCTDIGLGVCIWVLWLVVLIEVLTVPALMNSALQPAGVFYLFSFFCLVAAVFMWVYLKETRGLTDS